MFGVTSRKGHRVWPKEFFAEIKNHLIKKYDTQIILFYAPQNKKYNDEEFNELLLANKFPEKVFTNIRTK